MSEKLIFPIGFDLESGVKQVKKDWEGTYQKRISDLLGKKPIDLRVRLSAKGFNTKELQEFIRLAKEARKATAEAAKASKAAAQITKSEADARYRVARATINESNAKNSLELSNARVKKANADALFAEGRLAHARKHGYDSLVNTNKALGIQSTYIGRLITRMSAYVGIYQAFNFIRNIREVTAQFELQRVALGAIIQDAAEANKMFEEIKAAAIKSPFQIKELVTFTKQLAAYKIETNELFETTQRLADISAGLGVSMDRIVLAYGQIRATGYLRASEVRQLTEAGIPIVESLAKKMSELRDETVSAADVMQLISERAISFGMVKDIFEDMTSAGGLFYKMQEKQADTLQGQWSNLRDTISIMYEEIGKTPSVNSMMKGFISITKSLADNWRVLSNLIELSLYALAGRKLAIAIYNLVLQQRSLSALTLATKNYKAAVERRMLAEKRLGYVGSIFAKTQVLQTRMLREAAVATNIFRSSLLKLGAFFVGNAWNIALAAVTIFITYLASANQKAKQLNKELSRINADGLLQSDQSVRNFQRLADAISESADGSYEQKMALDELKRTYGDIIPTQDLEVGKLREMKGSYESLTQAIKEKIAAQTKEQKISTIISEYGQKTSKREKDTKEMLQFIGLSKDEANRVVEGIKEAVESGLLDLEKRAEEASGVLENIFVEQLGKSIKDSTRLVWGGANRLLRRKYMQKLISTYTEMQSAIENVNEEMDESIGAFGLFSERYEKLRNELKTNIGKGREFSFEWNESKTEANVNSYIKFINDIIAQHNKIAEDSGYKPISFKAELGKEIDFDALTKAIEGGMPQLKKAIAKVQAEYSNLLPKGMSKLIKEKWQEISTATGVAMDKLDNYFKDNETDTKKWAESLQDNLEKLELKLFDLNRQQERFNQGMVGWRDLSSEIKATNEEITALTIMLRFFDELLEKKSTGKNPKIEELNNELSTVEKIYKKYQELRRFMSEADAKASVNEMFKGVNLKYLQMAVTPEQMREQYESALSQAKDLGDNKLILDIEYSLGEFNVNDSKKKMEEDLKDLSDKIARTKTAKEFFDRMLGMTGDKQLSASLTVSIYGGEMGDDLGERLAKDMATKFQEQVQTYFGDIDISSAINKATGEIDPIKLEKLLTEENIEKMGKDNVIEVRKIINDLIKANADYATELFKSYEKFFDYEKRMTMVTQREEEERKKIRESMIPDDQKAQLEEASKKREQEQISAIEIEQLKDTADWEKTFEDLNNLGSLTVKNLISLLEDYIAKKKEAGEPIAESDMKTLMNELNQLRERDAQLDPFATIKASLKDLTDATKEYNKAKKDGDEKGMADAQNKRAKALNNLETAVNAVASGFQNLSNLLTEFQELLGIEDDSAMGEVFNGAAKALGFVATALSTAIALTLLWNSTLWANPLFAGVAIVSGVLGAIAGVFSAIANAKVRKANKEIERQQELLDNLAYSYERLEKSQEKVFGSDYISNYEQRIANLQAQQEAYLKQADAERSKGKKADSDKIKQYEEQAREAADSIKDMQSEVQEYFLGTDMASAARDFAQAWIDAYVEFGNTTDAMKEKFSDMIQNMIVESFAAKIIQSALEPIFSSIDTMTKDGMLDVGEAVRIAQMTDDAVGNIDVGMSNLMTALESAGITVRDMGSGLTGISKDIATASEESILGLAAGINTQNFYISQVPTKLDTIISLLQGGNLTQGSGITLQDLVTIQNQHLAYLPNIAQNTAETVAECKLMVAETRRTADALERVIKPKGTQTTYTLNTTIN